jgi:hypothetical protein
MSEEAVFGILAPAWSLSRREVGRRFLEDLSEVAPELVPERFGVYEPLRSRFDATDLEGALNSWGTSFLWKRRKPRVEGRAWSRSPRRIHDAIYITTTRASLGIAVFEGLVARLDALVGVDLAYLHLRCDAEMADREYFKTHIMPFTEGLTTFDLERGLPDICWATFFGGPYIELFGADQLLASPVNRQKSIGKGVLLQLTGSLADVQRNPTLVREAKERVKQHLGQDAFVFGGRNARRVAQFRANQAAQL